MSASEHSSAVVAVEVGSGSGRNVSANLQASELSSAAGRGGPVRRCRDVAAGRTPRHTGPGGRVVPCCAKIIRWVLASTARGGVFVPKPPSERGGFGTSPCAVVGRGRGDRSLWAVRGRSFGSGFWQCRGRTVRA